MQNTNPAPSPDFKRCTGSKKRALSWPRYACLGSCPCATSCPQEPERSPSTVSPAPAGFAEQQTSSPLLSGIQLINSPFLRAGICTLQLQSPSRLASQKTHVFYRKKRKIFSKSEWDFGSSWSRTWAAFTHLADLNFTDMVAAEPGDEAHSLCKHCPNYAGCEHRGSGEGQAPPQLVWGPPASSISRGAGTLVISFSSFLSALNQFFLFYFKFMVTTEGKAALGARAGSSAAWWSISGVLMPGNAAEIALWGHWMSNFKAHASTSFPSPSSGHTKAASGTHHCHPSSPRTNAGSFQEPPCPIPPGEVPMVPPNQPPRVPLGKVSGLLPSGAAAAESRRRRRRRRKKRRRRRRRSGSAQWPVLSPKLCSAPPGFHVHESPPVWAASR